jgi:hypothetical protein
MTGPVATTEPPPLPYRARPPQVLLGIGAVLLLTAGATVASAYGGGWARLLLFGLAAVAATFSLRAGRMHLTSSEETLAACATGLGLAAGDLGGPELGGTPGIPLLLAIVFLVLHLAWPKTASWPIASWLAAQLAVLHGVHWLPEALHTELYLCVSLVGLAIALIARRVVARVALVTTAPWWLAGVVGGSSSAWVDSGVVQWVSAALMIAAGFGLVLARLREVLEPLLGPPRAVPVIAGIVSGAAVTGAFSSLGPLAMTITGYAGVLLATLSANSLDGWHRGLFLPIALSAGVVMTVLCVVQLVAGGRWAELSLLLLLTAAPTVLLAVHRPADRPVAVPTAVGCLGGAVLLALAADLLGPSIAAALLTLLYGATMIVAAGLEPHTRHATAGVAAACAGAALLPPIADSRPGVVAALLAAQGLFTLGFAWRSGRRHEAAAAEPALAGWRVGAAQLVLAAWISAALADLAAIECYSLPAAAGLLLAAGPRLASGPSWPSWAPGLLVAAVPSTLLAVATSAGLREVSVLLVAALAMVGGARWSVRAPVLVGAGTALALSVGLGVRQLPWPLGSALLIGSALLAVGMLRERHPVAGFGARLADLR